MALANFYVLQATRTDSLNASVQRVFWQDKRFWLALSLGPACWYLLFELNVPLRNGAIPWQSIFWVALVYPVLEEYVFRTGIQSALYKRSMMANTILGISLANVATSLLFAAMHLINQPPLWAALVFFPSLIFGWARDRYGNIHASIVLHVIYNTGFIWLF